MKAPVEIPTLPPVEVFDSLLALAPFHHAFLCRVPGLDVHTDREDALARLAGYHDAARRELGFPVDPFATALQVHGNRVTVLREPSTQVALDSDGLLTALPGLTLGVYVADCCAIYLADPVRKAIGLLHSGRKGTELGIARRAVEAMTREFGTNPADLVAQLSPCIRPPHYDVDFAADIFRQLQDAGVGHIADCGIDTAADLTRYYSYRMEKGRTGRLLALFMIR